MSEKFLIRLSPESLKCNVVLNHDIVSELKLTNLTESPVAFKVKTTAPDRYQVRPIVGLIPAGKTEAVVIMLKRMTAFPDPNNPREVKHKFLVQSAIYDTENVQLSEFWHEKEQQHKPKEGITAYYDQRMSCELIVPTADPAASVEGSVSGDAAAIKAQLEEKQREYDGLMDYSIKQSNSVRQLETNVAALEQERSSLLVSQDTLTAHIESLRARVAELENLEEAEKSTRAAKAAKDAAPKTIVDRVKAPIELIVWQVIVLALVSLLLGVILF